EKASRRRGRGDRGDHLEKRVADRHDGVHEPELGDAGVAERHLEAEHGHQVCDRRVEVARGDDDLSEAHARESTVAASASSCVGVRKRRAGPSRPCYARTMTTHAATFRRLHAGPDPLVPANCWDAGSARLLEHLGARAVATTSAGVAWTHGYPDGDVLPVDRLIATVSSITRVLGVPLTVDAEGGYSDDPAAVGEM